MSLITGNKIKKTTQAKVLWKRKGQSQQRILRSLSFDNNGLVKPRCGTVALYGPFGFYLRCGRLSMNNLGWSL